MSARSTKVRRYRYVATKRLSIEIQSPFHRFVFHRNDQSPLARPRAHRRRTIVSQTRADIVEMIQSRCQSRDRTDARVYYRRSVRTYVRTYRRGESTKPTKDDGIGARLEESLPTFVSRVVGTRRIGGDVGGGFCVGVEGVRAKRKEGRAACSHGAETAALHLNDDKSRSFEDTGRLGYKRGKGGFNDPLTARQADAGQTSASPRSNRRRKKDGGTRDGRRNVAEEPQAGRERVYRRYYRHRLLSPDDNSRLLAVT